MARKKKRLKDAEVEVLEAIKRRDVLKAEVVAGEAEVSRAASVKMPVPTDVGDEIAQLKALLVAAEEERDAVLRSNSSKRQATMPRTSVVRARTDHIPPMPTSGSSRIESVVARSTIRSPGNPRIG